MPAQKHPYSSTDTSWRCELCGCGSIGTDLASWKPGTLGPQSLCCPCSALAARAAQLSRRCRVPLGPVRQTGTTTTLRRCTRRQQRIRQRWNLRTSIVNDPIVEATMRRHTWQCSKPGQLKGNDLPWRLNPEWTPPIVIRSAGRKGNGAFASRQLNTLEVIGEYSGEVVRAQLLSSEYTFELYCAGLVVDAAHQGNLTRFINHAKPPLSNVVADITVVRGLRKIVLRAACSIDSGDELLLDYGYEQDGWVGT